MASEQKMPAGYEPDEQTTPEMIEAGLAALTDARWWTTEGSAWFDSFQSCGQNALANVVEAVYLAMRNESDRNLSESADTSVSSLRNSSE
jgi:hypothetical protein